MGDFTEKKLHVFVVFVRLFLAFLKESALRLILSSSRDVQAWIYLSVGPLPMRFFSRPVIGPQVT